MWLSQLPTCWSILSTSRFLACQPCAALHGMKHHSSRTRLHEAEGEADEQKNDLLALTTAKEPQVLLCHD